MPRGCATPGLRPQSPFHRPCGPSSTRELSTNRLTHLYVGVHRLAKGRDRPARESSVHVKVHWLINEHGVTTWQTRYTLVPRGCATPGLRPQSPFHRPCGPSSTRELSTNKAYPCLAGCIAWPLAATALRPCIPVTATRYEVETKGLPLCPGERRAAHQLGLLPAGFAEKYLSASAGDKGTGRTLRHGPPPASVCRLYWSCSPSDDDDWLSLRLKVSLSESYTQEHTVESVDWLSSSIGRGGEAGE